MVVLPAQRHRQRIGLAVVVGVRRAASTSTCRSTRWRRRSRPPCRCHPAGCRSCSCRWRRSSWSPRRCRSCRTAPPSRPPSARSRRRPARHRRPCPARSCPRPCSLPLVSRSPGARSVGPLVARLTVDWLAVPPSGSTVLVRPARQRRRVDLDHVGRRSDSGRRRSTGRSRRWSSSPAASCRWPHTTAP